MAASAAAIAAAAEQRRKQQEEEEMTNYTPEELGRDWEFKIVRANQQIFRKSEVLANLVKEEAQAGWVMVEKFDDQRIRFKRPRSAQSSDAKLPEGYNPYRTQYGPSDAALLLKIFSIIIVLVALFLLVLFFFLKPA